MRSSDGAEAGWFFHLWNLIHREHRAPFAHGWSGFLPSFLQPSHLSERREEQVLLSQSVMTHRPTGGSTAPSQAFCVGTFTQWDAVTAPCVGFNTYKISCPYLWFARDYIAYKPSDVCDDIFLLLLLIRQLMLMSMNKPSQPHTNWRKVVWHWAWPVGHPSQH